jgi:hypothetical protein
MAVNLFMKYLFHIGVCRVFNMAHGTDGFTSPRKEVLLQIFITLTNLLSSAGFEPTNLGSSGNHANHYATEDHIISLTFYVQWGWEF